ncbi:MAG: hypothetical protein GPJ21_05520 [Microcystis aeruginosa W13-11]|jgi:uncharacterized protein (UPF0332 family)|nr:hypothetical protein [Microcystis aeruginosa W13-11]
MNRIQTLLSLAKEELYAAEILFENTLYCACISRAYYSFTQQQASKTLENTKLFISETTKWLENNQIQ